MNYICENLWTPVCPGMVPHFLILIVQWFTILAWILESPGEFMKILILGPHPGSFSLESLWERAWESLFFKVP